MCRKIDVRLWNDEKFRRLSDDGKLVYLFTMTHPNLTPLGAMRSTSAGLAAELGWKQTRFNRAFEAIRDAGMMKYDAVACCIVLSDFFSHNKPESPNVVRSWARWAEAIPECSIKLNLIDSARQLVEGLGEAFLKAFLEAFPDALRQVLPKAMPNQEQEQEHKQEQKTPPQSPSGARVRDDSPSGQAEGQWLAGVEPEVLVVREQGAA